MTDNRRQMNPSNEELIVLVRERAIELGRTPLRKEFVFGSLASRRYGNWKGFLKIAGLEPGETKLPVRLVSNERLLQLVREYVEEHGQPPLCKDFPYYDLAKRRFGSWHKFLISAGLKFDERKISNEELIELVRKRAVELGKVPKASEFSHRAIATSRYGSWNNFLISANLRRRGHKDLRDTIDEQQLLVSGEGQSDSHDQTHKAIRKEELITLMQEKAAELGRTPKFVEFPHSPLAVQKYGSWAKFVRSAGLKPESRKRVCNEQLIELVQKQAKELGHTPFQREFIYGSLATARFGNWRKFLDAAGLELQRQKIKSYLSDEELIELVKEKAAELGRLPRMKELEFGQEASSRFGGWEEFLRSAGLKDRSTEEPSNRMLLKLVQQQAKELGRPPQKREFEYGKLAADRHGTWHTFLIRAGLVSKRQESFKSWLGKSLSW